MKILKNPKSKIPYTVYRIPYTRSPKSRAGQSLVEVLIAISIGALIIGAAVGAISITIKSDTKNVSSSFAIPLARDLIDKTRSISEGGWANLYNQPRSTDLYIVSDGSLKIITGKEGLLENDIQNGLVGYWKLDEASGTNAYDSTANNNQGVLLNSPTPGAENCKVGGCLLFDTSAFRRIRVPDRGVFDSPTTLTLSAWIFPRSVGGSNSLGTIILGSGSYYLSFNDASNALSCYRYGTTPAGYHTTPSGSVPLNQWSHILCAWDGTKISQYINGILKNTVDVTGAGNNPTGL